MIKQRLAKAGLLAGAAAFLALPSFSLAQTVDALLDKLVDKGILTVKEADELREQSEKGFNTELASKTGMADWVTSFRINGDFRGRYEAFYFDQNPPTDRQRFRYRARIGFTAVMKDAFEVGIRFGTGDLDNGIPIGGIDPISNNQSLQNDGSKKGVFVDLAYAKWSPLQLAEWNGALTFGKMENPFVFPSTMMFDRDYTPEGGAAELTYRPHADHSIKGVGVGFILDELANSSHEPYMFGGQIRWDATWNQKLSSSAGFSGFYIEHPESLVTTNVPNVNRGNTRTAAGALVYDYAPIQADASVTYTMEHFPLYAAPFPIMLFGEYAYNTATSQNNQGYGGGIMFGKSGRKGLWDVSYQYRALESDAWYEEVTESDFGGNYITAPTGGSSGTQTGTNVRGHIFRVQYSPYDMLTLACTYWLTELIHPNPAGSNSKQGRLQLDATLKF